MPSVVPPTAVAYGSLDGVSTPEPSPAEKSMLTPSAAARSRYACSMLSMLSGTDSSPPSQELDAICASGWPPTPLRMVVSALNRACSP